MKSLRSILVFSLALCGTWLAFGRLAQTETVEPKSTPPKLVVHEWGTFTSFSGSNGIKLEFRPLETSDLPEFVYTRARQSGIWFSKAWLPAIQRMETPVTYFYTPVERDVQVRVEFPQGLLTEFYPPVRKFAPQDPKDPEAAPPLKNSMLDWGTVHLIPTDLLQAHVQDPELARRIGRHVADTMVPPTGSSRHYDAARRTDSAIVQVRHTATAGSHIPPGDYFEKFLFYRGLGNFDLPLVLTAESQNQFALTNNGADEVRSLFLVTVKGEQLWFKRFDRVGPGSTLNLALPREPSKLEELIAAVERSIVAEGLYELEAHAMVDTWRQSWFGEEGTRLFYVVPARMTNELLPLHITPTPDETVRVLVGRMEIMTPSQEQHILDLVKRSLTTRKTTPENPEDASANKVLTELQSLGRLAEPALVRAQHVSTDGDLQQEAIRLIGELRAAQTKEAGG